MKNLILLIGIALLITGCATTGEHNKALYKEGYGDTRIQDDIFKVTFKGNDTLAYEKAQDLALLRCAEVTLDNKYNYFIIIDDQNPQLKLKSSDLQPEKKKGLIALALSTHTLQIYKIQCFKDKPENVEGIIYNAEQVKTNIKNKYEIP